MRITHIIGFTLTMALTACSGKESTPKEMPVVAHIEEVNGEQLTVCQYDLLTDTVDIPLSDLVEELQFVKLDNREEALVGETSAVLSDNYVLFLADRYAGNMPCKLFRKDGTFINKIGSFGQGPGEYVENIYDAQIDEKHGRIYLLPWITDRILVYNLKGEYETFIKLNMRNPALRVAKGTFHIDADKNLLSVVLLPFNHLSIIAWTQDLEGNITHEVPSGHLKLQPTFDWEVIAPKTTDAQSFHIYTYNLRKDTLYHFDTEKGKLLPRFTLDYGEQKIEEHRYYELPNHYYGFAYQKIRKRIALFQVEFETRYFLIEKATGKGNYCRIYEDGLYDREVTLYNNASTWSTSMNGYYHRSIEPLSLLDEIDEALAKHPEWNKEKRTKLEKLKAAIDEDDNNYLIYGKLKR